ncbi:MAG: restriction endonuclease subunit S [Bacteroidota bacterium]
METKSLSELVEFVKDKLKPEQTESIYYVGLEHIQKETGKIVQKNELSAINSTKNRFIKGDILYGKLRPNLNKVALASRSGVCSTDILVIRPGSKVRASFLHYLMLGKEFVNEMSQNTTGVNLPRVSKKTIENYQIPLFPLEDQKRIVEKVETLFNDLDASVSSLQKALAKLKTYRQSVLQQAFEGKLTAQWRAAESEKGKLRPAEELLSEIKEARAQHYAEALEKAKAEGTRKPKKPKEFPPVSPSELGELPVLPKGWLWVRLGEIAEMVLGKMLDKKKNKGRLQQYLRNVNVRWGVFDLDNLLSMRFEEHEDERYGLREGDLVVCEGGEPGRSAIWRGKNGSTKIQKALHRVRFPKAIKPEFVYFFMLYSSQNGHLESRFTGTTIKHLTGKKFSELPIPLCSLPEQKQIVTEINRRFEKADRLEATIQASLKQAETLRQSILKKAFAGELLAAPEKTSNT